MKNLEKIEQEKAPHVRVKVLSGLVSMLKTITARLG